MHHGALMELEETLTRQARDYYGDNARVDRLVTLSGGASREAYGFDVLVGADRPQRVLGGAGRFRRAGRGRPPRARAASRPARPRRPRGPRPRARGAAGRQ